MKNIAVVLFLLGSAVQAATVTVCGKYGYLKRSTWEIEYELVTFDTPDKKSEHLEINSESDTLAGAEKMWAVQSQLKIGKNYCIEGNLIETDRRFLNPLAAHPIPDIQ